MNMKLGVSLKSLVDNITLDNLMQIRQSSIETLEIASRLFTSENDSLISLCRDTFAAGSPRVASIHAAFGSQVDISIDDPVIHQAAVDELLKSIRIAAALCADFVIVHASFEPIADTERAARIEQAIATLNEVKPVAAAKGVQLAVEFLPRTCLGNCVEELIEIIDKVDSPHVKACLDVNHLMNRYCSLPEVVRQLNKRLVTLHLSDYDGVDEKHWLPGNGVIDWAALLVSLSEIEYAGPFNYEVLSSGDDLDNKIAALEENFIWLSVDVHKKIK